MISGSIFDKKDTIFKILIQGSRKISLHFRDKQNAKIADLKIMYSSIDTDEKTTYLKLGTMNYVVNHQMNHAIEIIMLIYKV